MADMLWSGWGDPDRATRLPDAVVDLLGQMFGASRDAAPQVPLDEIEPPPGALPRRVIEALAAAVGGRQHVRLDAETRIRHTRGKSTPDLVRIRRGDVATAPDAVLLPGSHDDVLSVLRLATEHRLAVVPFGGGTSVTGGLSARPDQHTGVIALDLRRLDRLVEVDPRSRTATVQAGLRAPRAEALLGEHGFTLGHFPQSYEWASLGGFAATRSSGQASAGYGRFDDMVVGLTVATPRGTWELGRAPRSAAGPDLRHLVLGSEGAFGVITSLTVQIRPAPEVEEYEGWWFPSFETGTAAMRALAQSGQTPTVLRLSDEAETMAGLSTAADPEAAAGPEASPGGCLMITGYAGSREDVTRRRAHTATLLRRAGGEPRGPEPGRSWARGRYAAPYLRDALLDVGVFAETLETATFWSNLPRLYTAVRDALNGAMAEQGVPGLVLCHISHVYPAGASLYYTVVTALGDDPTARWAAIKRAAGDAIIAAGGTISHHHGVGLDHRDWFAAEAGLLGVEVLRAVKRRLDPAGILNPGVLVPPAVPDGASDNGTSVGANDAGGAANDAGGAASEAGGAAHRPGGPAGDTGGGAPGDGSPRGADPARDVPEEATPADGLPVGPAR